jgi:hypothetical protein
MRFILFFFFLFGTHVYARNTNFQVKIDKIRGLFFTCFRGNFLTKVNPLFVKIPLIDNFRN